MKSKMKNLCLMFSLLFLVANVTIAQVDAIATDSKSETEEILTGPQMKFDSYEVDYGEIEQGSDPYRFFKFTNVGTEPLQITNAKGSCGCTVPTYPKEPIFPGETGEIKVRYDTKRIGAFVKRVTLTTNEKLADNTPKEGAKLTIKGKVFKAPEEPEGIPSNTPSILTPNGN